MVGGGVVLEFGSRDKVWPAARIIGAEDMKINFNFLVGSLYLFIGLGMVDGGESDIVFQESC